MKWILPCLLFFSVISGSAQTTSPLDSSVWHSNYQAAREQAKETDKPLLMVFSGSDWCKPCIMLREQILVKPEFSDWARAHVVCITLDFPSQKKNKLPQYQQQQNDSLAERFNPAGVFPLVVIIDKDENILGTTGYKDITPVEYIGELEKIINQ